MYNTDLPQRAELPSSKQLITSTVTAMGVAGVLLVTTVLPAEYGIDPTGVGKVLGLTEMGEIKVSLVQESEQDNKTQQQAEQLMQAQAAMPVEQVETSIAEPQIGLVASEPEPTTEVSQTKAESVIEDVAQKAAEPVVETVVAPEPEPVIPSDQRSLTLKPGEAIELKLKMKQGAQVKYDWSVDQGHLNYDMHADNASISYQPYQKALKVTSDAGLLIAAFDGGHGWFWRNRSKKLVTLTLNVSGDYQKIYRVK